MSARGDGIYLPILPSLAAAIGLEAGEEIQWSLTDKNTLSVQRVNPPVKSAIVEAAKKGKTSKRK